MVFDNRDIAEFEKVSFEQYKKDVKNAITKSGIDISSDENFDETIREVYEGIKLPRRSTSQSAGYDFYIPGMTDFEHHRNFLIPTGIRCYMQPGWVLMLMPKSGLGTKYGMELVNTVGVVDADYYKADNEGHIMASISVKKNLHLDAGDKFMQGIFVPFGTAIYDDPSGDQRHGGFGSTGK